MMRRSIQGICPRTTPALAIRDRPPTGAMFLSRIPLLPLRAGTTARTFNDSNIYHPRQDDFTSGPLAFPTSIHHFQSPQPIRQRAGLIYAAPIEHTEKFSGHTQEHIVSLDGEVFRLPPRLGRSTEPDGVRGEQTLKRPLLPRHDDVLLMRATEKIQVNRDAKLIRVGRENVHDVVRVNLQIRDLSDPGKNALWHSEQPQHQVNEMALVQQGTA